MDTSSNGRVLEDLSALKAELARALAENESLKARAQSKIQLRVSEKGCVQILGIGSKWGVTLYPDTLLRMLGMADQLKAFIETNRDNLSWK